MVERTVRTRTSPSCCDHVLTVQPSPATNATTPAYRRTFSSRKMENGSPRERPASCACCSTDILPCSFHCSNWVKMVKKPSFSGPDESPGSPRKVYPAHLRRWRIKQTG